MIRIVLRGLPLLVLAGVLAGCGDDDVSAPAEPGGDDRLQMPLAVGNRWVQRVVVTAGDAFDLDNESFGSAVATARDAFDLDNESLGSAVAGSGADTTTVWSTLTGTEERHDSVYFVQSDSSETGVTTSYLRQSGSELYTEFSIPAPVDVEVARRVVDMIERTMPWKVCQFGAASGTEWRLGAIDTTLVLQGSAYDVRFDVVASSRGVSPITVPAGSWPEAQIFRLHLSGSAGIVGFPAATQSSYQDVWFVDGVGVVKQHNVDSFDSPQGSFTIESTGELIEFQVQTGQP